MYNPNNILLSEMSSCLAIKCLCIKKKKDSTQTRGKIDASLPLNLLQLLWIAKLDGVRWKVGLYH